MRLWVTVPAYDEERRLPQTLDALAAQDDLGFTLVVVDNGSADGTRAVVERFAAPFEVHLLDEPERGVGSAVDTGFRFAIAHGATHLARTDADCLPRRDWVRQVRTGFRAGAELVCGRIAARRDENGLLARAGFRAMVVAAVLFGRWRATNRGPEFLVPYAMHAGHNMAITADLYQRCGGMPRMPAPTDRTFLNRVRRHTTRVQQRRGMVSETSLRRIHAYGVLGAARWYLDRGPGALTRDPR